MSSKNSTHNYLSITNNDCIHSCEKIKNDRIPTTSTPNHHAQRIAATSANLLNLHTTTKLPPLGKYYFYFQNDGKNAQATKCIKSRIMIKVVYYVLLIDTFEQQFAVLKGTL